MIYGYPCLAGSNMWIKVYQAPTHRQVAAATRCSEPTLGPELSGNGCCVSRQHAHEHLGKRFAGHCAQIFELQRRSR